MKSNYKKFGQLIEKIDVSSDGTVKDLIGVNIDKCFIPSVANIIGTDLKNYKIIEKDDFNVYFLK